MSSQQSQQPVAYTTHGNGRLILPWTLSTIAVLIALILFIGGNMAIAWIFYLIDPWWGMFAYKMCWVVGLYATMRKCLRVARGR